jgi:hypothetical protein
MEKKANSASDAQKAAKYMVDLSMGNNDISGLIPLASAPAPRKKAKAKPTKNIWLRIVHLFRKK